MDQNPSHQNPSQPHSRDADWQPCPAGTLHALGGQLRGQRFRKRLSVASAAAAGVFVLAVAVFATLPGAQPVQPVPAATVTSITCREVRENAPQYLAGNVPVELKARMDKHLGKCRSCEKFLHGQRPTAMASR